MTLLFQGDKGEAGRNGADGDVGEKGDKVGEGWSQTIDIVEPLLTGKYLYTYTLHYSSSCRVPVASLVSRDSRDQQEIQGGMETRGHQDPPEPEERQGLK